MGGKPRALVDLFKKARVHARVRHDQIFTILDHPTHDALTALQPQTQDVVSNLARRIAQHQVARLPVHQKDR